MWIYLLKIRDENPFNDYHKIGISSNVKVRVEYIRASLREAGLHDNVKVRFKAYIVGAYFVEQMLHKMYRRKRKSMPKTVSGYTEFFDLNFITIYPIIWILTVIQFIQFIVSLGFIWYCVNSIWHWLG